jgi:segregation and condensation protein B
MPPSADPPFEPNQQGVSLDKLAEAFAQVMRADRPPAEQSPPQAAEPAATAADSGAARAAPPTAGQPIEPALPPQTAEDDSCPISPRSILEAMLFVGNRSNEPLSARQAAELMRDVTADEIPPLVAELNRRYQAESAPYCIASGSHGYRLVLRREFHPLRYGRIREARLSQAAIDVLALVAYQQPVTGEQIQRLRSKPSKHVLSHLLRRGLLRIERPEASRRAPHYYTTDRFLRLFHLGSLDDLPRSEEAGPP